MAQTLEEIPGRNNRDPTRVDECTPFLVQYFFAESGHCGIPQPTAVRSRCCFISPDARPRGWITINDESLVETAGSRSDARAQFTPRGMVVRTRAGIALERRLPCSRFRIVGRIVGADAQWRNRRQRPLGVRASGNGMGHLDIHARCLRIEGAEAYFERSAATAGMLRKAALAAFDSYLP
jgi:hypothetical protein